MNQHTYEGFPILLPVNECKGRYLDKIREVLADGYHDYKNLTIARLDLRFPAIDESDDFLMRDEVLSLRRRRKDTVKFFIRAIELEMAKQECEKRAKGKRMHRCKVRYVWARERNHSHNDHYHFALVLNKDRFYCWGKFENVECGDGLYNIIVRAWAKAIGLCNNQAMGLVHIPDNSIYYLHGRPESSERAEQEYKDIFYRLSYLAKKRTKRRNEGFRCFGSSTK
ncbi:hypothetical protein BZJ19_15805 [Salinivibrio proteolyticus]|uniref:inovirus Gp2 family protein n=1 Tax=Salinivibrio proteolyticus TaxID=334715 RepID=UPI0009892390|nr:inovirus Gp2 family protein [Salinivibrio proteolyticus]OOF21771.1 hypothetical protein BZJ19_15805 [Salinivibrio proteolyticus]